MCDVRYYVRYFCINRAYANLETNAAHGSYNVGAQEKGTERGCVFEGNIEEKIGGEGVMSRDWVEVLARGARDLDVLAAVDN